MLLNLFTSFLSATWGLTLEMAPWLLLGFIVAGVLHVLLPSDRIARHLADGNFASVFKAALIGIPLPICSCGVIPVAASLRRSGAGKGATAAFLVSTPMTGLDSVFAVWAMLGGLFAVMSVVTTFVAGIFAGVLVNLFDPETHSSPSSGASAPAASEARTRSLVASLLEALRYGLIVLIIDVRKWLIIGILAGGAIAAFVPEDFIHRYLSSQVLSYLAMLIVGIPMYVCSVGSIPVAAALIMKGMAPGAALVLLIAGPATNTATLSFVAGKLGKRTAALYLSAIVMTAVVFGLVLDLASPSFAGAAQHHHHDGSEISGMVDLAAAGLFLALLVVAPTLKRWTAPRVKESASQDLSSGKRSPGFFS